MTGWFDSAIDRAVKRGVERAVQRWSKDKLPEIIDKIILKGIDERLPKGDLTRHQFTYAMAAKFAEYGMPPVDAVRHAKGVLRAMLADEGIRFGHKDWDWSRDGARTAAWECDIQYWGD